MNSNSKWPIIIIVIIILVVAVYSMGKCSCSSSNSDADWGAAYDWGDNYYWDSGEHKVKEKTKCVAKGTLITMADGTQKPIEQVTVSDLILTFDHETGEYVSANPIAVYSHGYATYPVAELTFSDGNTLCVISGHVFFDLDLMKYVEITPENCSEYIGHHFVKYSEVNVIDTTILVSASAREEYTEAWGTWGISSLACITNGILSLPNADGTYNYFDFDSNLKYDEEAMARDIEEYGLYTYEEWSDLIPYEVFDGFNFKYFKVAIGKGLATYETYLDHIRLFYELSDH